MGHTYNDLKNHVPEEERAKKCAERVPLVHTISDGNSREKLIGALQEGLLSPGKVEMRRERTSHSEEALGYPPSVYFYAGRSFPKGMASAALLFGGALNTGEPDRGEAESNMKGGATPFDSGGVVHGKSALCWQDFAGSIADDRASHTVSVSKWRSYFSVFLTQFFSQAEDYWEGVPCCPIDNADLANSTNPQRGKDWTFEVRSEKEVEIRRSGCVFVSENVMSALNSLTERYPLLDELEKRNCLFGASSPGKAAEARSRDLVLT